jgi:hypothetical protein
VALGALGLLVGLFVASLPVLAVALLTIRLFQLPVAADPAGATPSGGRRLGVLGIIALVLTALWFLLIAMGTVVALLG